jgi:hypothetical protein
VFSPDRKNLNTDRFGSFDSKEGWHHNQARGKSQFITKIKIKKEGLDQKKITRHSLVW